MDSVKMNKLDAKLREMFEVSKQTEAKRNQRRSQSGRGNVIRRRKGEHDKRISL